MSSFIRPPQRARQGEEEGECGEGEHRLLYENGCAVDTMISRSSIPKGNREFYYEDILDEKWREGKLFYPRDRWSRRKRVNWILFYFSRNACRF
jgi:hypothetical protein